MVRLRGERVREVISTKGEPRGVPAGQIRVFRDYKQVSRQADNSGAGGRKDVSNARGGERSKEE